MFTRLRAAFAVAILIATASAAALAGPTAVIAANPSDPDGSPWTDNLAGRPLNGYTYDTCSPIPTCDTGAPRQWNPSTASYIRGEGTGHGIAYANVGGLVALLYPYHGRANSSYDGKLVYGPNDSAIGYWQTQSSLVYNGDTAAEHDLAVIILYDGNWPSALNQVYRGNVTGDDFWTITMDTSIAPSCFQDGNDNSDTMLGLISSERTVYQNGPQYSYLSTNAYRTGTLDQYQIPPQGNCVIRVSLTDTSDTYRDSGSPFVLCCNAQNYVHTVWGIASSRDTDGPGPPYMIQVTPLYEGLAVLYHKYQALGSTAGLCKTATCGGLT